MNIGKYAIDEPSDDETEKSEDYPQRSHGESRASARAAPGIQEPTTSTSWQAQNVNPFERRTLDSYASFAASYNEPLVQPSTSHPYLRTSSGAIRWTPQSLRSHLPTSTYGRDRLQSWQQYEARRSRGPASFVEARVKWMERGYQLLRRNYADPIYSVKVFLGGLPFESTPQSLQLGFREFPVVRILKSPREGHGYLILVDSNAVKALLLRCDRSLTGEYFFLLGSRRTQVIPWTLQEIEWGQPFEGDEAPKMNTIFVGGLHGETTAEHLKIIMEDKFGQVQYVKIDTDKHMYPSGSARVQFVFRQSYISAIEANFLEINAKHYSRTVQLEPFFEKGSYCRRCRRNLSTVMCRHLNCLDQYCVTCFELHQAEVGDSDNLHRAMIPP